MDIKNSIQPNKNEIQKRDRIHQFDKPEVVVGFEEWQKTILDNFPNLLFPSEVALSVISQLLINDITNPSAVIFMDSPASGKTIAVNFFADMQELTYATDKFTIASFVSHSTTVKKEKLPEIDLLPRIQYKMFLIRDFATIFSKKEDDLTGCLGILTRLLDGEGLSADSGVHGQREYTGDYLFMLLGATTPIPRKVWKIMGTLGSRLLFLKMPSRNKSKKEFISQLRDSTSKQKEKICRLATKNFLHTLWYENSQGVEWNRKSDEEKYMFIITSCGALLANLRGVVNPSDEPSDDYRNSTSVIEKPDRINQLFYNLVRGHALVNGRKQIDQTDLRMIIELTLDSANNSRSNLFRKIIDYKGVMKTSEVQSALKCSKPKAIKDMQTLEILGICKVEQPKRGLIGEPELEVRLLDEFKWFLSDEITAIRELPTQTFNNITPQNDDLHLSQEVWRINQ